ncbi:hypothetical protein B0T17DRAFT_592940 [Bombardia bombarda]|uniref:Microtubule associated protein n=1 Tax=Bombardia bombarda TaxID=252184 RepID=A0AA40BVI4_9PEZI|nr:hypothetical protein B0T17DRAFT_592940 [Bombardia bombarda]
MVQPARPPANAFVALSRKIYNPLGFAKGYNFVLFFIFGGALMGFTLARLQYLNFYGIFCAEPEPAAGPAECFYLAAGVERFGIILHLVTILPASFLACFQFVPAIRHKLMLFHRINGYLVILLALLATIGAFMITRRSQGGGVETQTALGLLGVMFLVSLALAYVNVKRLQLEQHRAWMLRAWFYAGSIITLRLILIICATIISNHGYYVVRGCDVLEYLIKDVNGTIELYPACESYFSGASPDQKAIVVANIVDPSSGAEAAAALEMSFGIACWLALAIHAIGVEVYLRLTPIEAERLRNVSYKRQLEAGMRNPGRAGITSDRIGDAPKWVPSDELHNRCLCRWVKIGLFKSRIF